MKNNQSSVRLIAVVTLVSLLYMQSAKSMAIRSFVALPIDSQGYVIRFSYEHLVAGDSNTFITSVAYGITHDKALLIGIPYKLVSNENDSLRDSLGDLSVLYRQTILQDDFFSGTSRLALLFGVIASSDNDRKSAIQAGVVYTFFKNRHEFDIDALYQVGVDDRPDSGRYDLSWQYRLTPTTRPDWGISSELNVVTELNGRWAKGNEIVHQLTFGLQLVNPQWVVESAVIKNINSNNELSVMLSTRFHF